MIHLKLILLLSLLAFGCAKQSASEEEVFFLGADLSYVNELLDCGAQYRSNGQLVDPYHLFGEKGANISRIRLWHSPDWKNGYSNYQDVELAIQRSKEAGMQILLDFHYSDTWADPQHQVIPKAWENIDDLNVLKDSLYNYTYQTLASLHAKGLTPEFVQVGNEINIEIMQDSANMVVDTINWERNITLINVGLQAVADFSQDKQAEIQKMIHIAQPENALWWFAAAEQYGLGDYDWMGISYYPKWSIYGLDSLGLAIGSLIKTYRKELMVVETAYPYTLENFDEGKNILGEEALLPNYPATPAGQYAFMKRLTDITTSAGGRGVIWWEPAWVSTDCSTPWNKGSNWENATWFDAGNGNEALEVFKIFTN
ncbi:MAG: glycosyl hydrolase 53 family protein [Cyclobacteriaceae bacterium]